MGGRSIAHGELFSGNIARSVGKAAVLLRDSPASGAAFVRLMRTFPGAAGRRRKQAAAGVEVPSLLIVSTTESCNLTCAGCYACESVRKERPGLTNERIETLLDEASALGVSLVMLAGGEPLLSHGWLPALSAHREMLGIVFTNGTLLNAEWVGWFDIHRHILPAISIEGTEAQTDARRGPGVYARAGEAMGRLRLRGIPFGVSVTVTSENIDTVLEGAFVREHIGRGCRFFIMVEYVPAAPGTRPLVLSTDDKRRLAERCEELSQEYPALCIAFPGGEDFYGGCLAAGRGFVHISASGNVEPCPFAPFSDVSLREKSLREALASPFLAAVRENHHLLKEGEGGCALWNNRAWLDGLLQNGGEREDA